MKSFLPNIDFNGAIKEQRNGEIIIWSYRTIYLFHEFVWESKYTKKCQDEHLFSSESQKIERKKQLQIENSGFLKPYHEQIKYKITKNSFRVKNIFCDFLQKKLIQQKLLASQKIIQIRIGLFPQCAEEQSGVGENEWSKVISWNRRIG